MADSQERQVEIQGKGYTVIFGLRALLALKDHWKLKTDQEVFEKLGTTSLSDVHILFWAMLRTHHKEVTPDMALDLLDLAGIEGLQDILHDAISAAAPRASRNAGDPPAKAQRVVKTRRR